MDALLESGEPLPTAIFAHNDLMALGALSRLREERLEVPGDVSLVGYNDLPMVGHLNPSLTTVHYPSIEVGKAAGEIILAVLEGETAEDRMLQPVLKARQSTHRV